MGLCNILTLFLSVVISICSARNIIVKQQKIANGFVNFLNSQPSRSYGYGDAKILNVKKLGDVVNVEIKVKATDLDNSDVSRYLKCLSTLTVLEDHAIAVQNNQYDCEEIKPLTTTVENEIESNTKVTRKKKYNREKRSNALNIGGETEKDPEDPHVKNLAEKSLIKYLLSVGNARPYLVLKIVKATEQVVAGTKTRIDFIASVSGYSPSDFLGCHSEVWEQPWVNKEEIKVTCDPAPFLETNSRRKRSNGLIIGGETEKDPQDPHVKNLAEKSLNKYLLSVGNARPYLVLKIVKATEQVVAGTKTRIDFIASVSGYSPPDFLGCHSEVWEQSWVNKEEIKVTCDPAPFLETNSRRKRSNGLIIGGETEKDPEDPHVKNLAEKSLNKYLVSVGNARPYLVLKIVKATEQVVAGTKTRIDFIASVSGYSPPDFLGCHSEVWEQSWVNKEEIKVTCDPAPFLETNSRRKRSNGFNTGSETEQDPEDPRVRNLAEKSLNKYLLSVGNARPYLVLNIVKATEQVDAGTMMRIDFIASLSEYSPLDPLACHSDVWEQPWFNQVQIKVSCDPAPYLETDSRRKTSNGLITGGETEKDPEDPHVKNLAEKSLNKYLLSVGNARPYLILKIVKATEQVVAGTMTRIDFIASVSGYSPSGFLGCHSEVWEQPWVNKEEIKVTCDPISFLETDSRRKRSNGLIIGGETEKDPEDPHVKNLAEKSLNKYLLSVGNARPYLILKIVKATEQVVAGTMTRIDFIASVSGYSPSGFLGCHSEVWEQPWVNKEEIKVTCDPISFLETDSRRKRSNGLIIGGETEKDPEDPHVKNLAEKSLNKYLLSVGNARPYLVLKIVKATEQVVAGTKTRIDFIASVSGYSPPDFLGCHSEVWEQSWVNKEEIKVTCVPAPFLETNSRRKMSNGLITGGETEKDPEDPHVKNLAEKSLNKYLLSVGNARPYLILKIVKATEQVVAGSMTRIDFIASVSGYSPSDFLGCHSEVWEQPWVNKEEIKVTCHPTPFLETNSRRKRSNGLIIGGETEKDPEDPHVKNLAEKSLNKYLLSVGNARPYLVLKIVKATEQVVAGTKTRIDFIASVSGYSPSNLLGCHSEVWEQSWVNKEEIKVTCDPAPFLDTNSRKKRSNTDNMEGETEKDPKELS